LSINANFWRSLTASTAREVGIDAGEIIAEAERLLMTDHQ